MIIAFNKRVSWGATVLNGIGQYLFYSGQVGDTIADPFNCIFSEWLTSITELLFQTAQETAYFLKVSDQPAINSRSSITWFCWIGYAFWDLGTRHEAHNASWENALWEFGNVSWEARYALWEALATCVKPRDAYCEPRDAYCEPLVFVTNGIPYDREQFATRIMSLWFLLQTACHTFAQE